MSIDAIDPRTAESRLESTPVSSFEAKLEAFGVSARRSIEAWLPTTEPAEWLSDLVGDYPRRPSKLIRPALLMATCEAFGGDDDDSLLLGVALELFHNAFLIHDDIADGSLRRRGGPTLHSTHGIGLALNAGDALGTIGHRALRAALDNQPPHVAAALVAEFDTMLARTVEGQAMELGWERDAVMDLRPEDYLELIMLKTCWYTTVLPLRAGAIVGSAGAAEVAPMTHFGFYLGAAFQIRDDVLNLVGDESSYGKEIGGDLIEGKRTLMLMHLLSEAESSDRELVVEFLRQPRQCRTEEAAVEVRGLMDRYGSVEFAVEYAAGIAIAAAEAFDIGFDGAIPNSGRQFVADLVPYMLERRR